MQGAQAAGARQPDGQSRRPALLHEVPDLVEYPSVVAGTFALEFLELPEEVLTTTLIHHQHYFPVVGEDGKLKKAFLAVINTRAGQRADDRAQRRARASPRGCAMRGSSGKRIARRRSSRASIGSARCCSTRSSGATRRRPSASSALAEWIAARRFGAGRSDRQARRKAARLAKADLATDMVREFTELQGTMGGIYARDEGLPEEVWKAIYYHYLPIGVEADAPPTRAQLGKAAVTWAAVSLADKLDTIVGLFAAGERPTGSRDPLGLRRQAQGVVKILGGSAGV